VASLTTKPEVKDWFEDWFGEEYLALYPHRDESEAQHAVDMIANELGDKQVRRVLDLACGAGRHARPLSDRWWTVGLDLSAVLLKVARGAEPEGNYVRGDMRALPFADRSFDMCVNLFTSFGYFESDAQHLRVLAEVARVVDIGGTFVLDFLNSKSVGRNLVARDQRKVGDQVVEQHRKITDDGRFVQKTISLPNSDRKFIERVRLFSVDELEMMLEESGFSVYAKHGDYSGGPITEDSPRAILFGTRE
jgi:ubiquinone/menaquinone biosynthesis C-methylase UbiE